MNESAHTASETEAGLSGRQNVLILGVGNVLLSDEGAGVHLVKALQDRYILPDGVEVLDGGTSGLDLLPHIENRSHLFIVDVINTADAEPGKVKRIALEDPPAYFRQKVTPHQLGLNEVLALADLSGTMPDTIVLFGLMPKDLKTGLELSPEAAAGLEDLLELLITELETMGHELKPRNRA